MEANDVVIDKNGYVYVYDSTHKKLYQYNNKGYLRSSVTIDIGSSTNVGPMHIVRDEIFIRNTRQEDQRIGRIKKGELEAVATDNSAKTRQSGIVGLSRNRYLVKLQKLKKGEISILNSSGTLIKTIDVPLAGIVSIVFLQEDRTGNIYVQTERLDKGKIVLEIIKHNAAGNNITTIPITDNDYESWMIKLLTVDERGNIYQFIPQKEKGQLILRNIE
jgi:hypothetical protein